MKIVRIVFCILACLFVAAAIPCGVFLGWIWFVILALCAAACAVVMFLAKRSSEPPHRSEFLYPDDAPSHKDEK